MAMWADLKLQNSNSNMMDNLISFHDHAMIIIIMIMTLIIYVLIFMISNKFFNKFLFQGHLIEILWTVIPIFFLIFLAIPSLKILYLSDEIYNPFLSVKILGHQWYWSYEYSDFKNLMFDSYMISEINNYNFRLLDVDNSLVVPVNLNLRLIISSMDVIHSFTVPSLGVKVDAIPGRLNQISINLNRPGKYYGQCSEICGVNHSFMPIGLESNSFKNFLNWIKNYKFE